MSRKPMTEGTVYAVKNGMPIKQTAGFAEGQVAKKVGSSNRHTLGAHSVSTPCSLSKHEPNSNQCPDADLQDKSIRRVGGRAGLMWGDGEGVEQ